MNLINKKNAFTLVETMVAISVLMLAILGPLSIASSGIRNSAFAKDQVTAYYLAQEGIEIIRLERDSYSLSGKDISGDKWIFENPKTTKECRVTDMTSDYGCIVDIFAVLDGATSNAFDRCVKSDCSQATRSKSSRLYLTPNGNYTHDDSNGNTPSKFKRVLKITPYQFNDPNMLKEVKVSSTVTWTTSGGGEKSFTLTESIFNLYGQQ